MVVAGGDDEQRVDPAPQQAPHELALALGVLLAGARDEHVPVSVRGVLHRAGDRRVERVGDVLDDEAQRAGSAMAQGASEVVAGEAQERDGGLDASGGVGAHAGLLVHDARNGLQAHARRACDVSHRCPRGHPAPLLDPVVRFSDNVVSTGAARL